MLIESYYTFNTVVAHSNELILIICGLILLYWTKNNIKLLGFSFIILGIYTLLEFAFQYYPVSIVDIVILGFTQITGLFLFAYFLLDLFYNTNTHFQWIKRVTILFYSIVSTLIIILSKSTYPNSILGNVWIILFVSIYYLTTSFIAFSKILQFFIRYRKSHNRQTQQEFLLILINIGLGILIIATFFYISRLKNIGNVLNFIGVLSTTIGYFKLNKNHNMVDLFRKVEDLEYQLQEIRSREKLMRELIEKSNLAVIAKNNFLANMSHELRTPLNIILGFSEILLIDEFHNLNSSQVQILTDLSTSAKNLTEMISKILNITDLETNQQKIQMKYFEFSKLLEDLHRIFDNTVKQSKIDLIFINSLKLKRFFSNYEAVQQILTNLIDNAIKFSDENTKIQINFEENDENVQISIVDNGRGIDEKDIPKLFQPFQQLENAMTKTKKGIGLGLYYSKILADRIAATIKFQPNAKGGSIFVLLLPKNNNI